MDCEVRLKLFEASLCCTFLISPNIRVHVHRWFTRISNSIASKVRLSSNIFYCFSINRQAGIKRMCKIEFQFPDWLIHGEDLKCFQLAFVVRCYLTDTRVLIGFLHTLNSHHAYVVYSHTRNGAWTHSTTVMISDIPPITHICCDPPQKTFPPYGL